MKLKRKTHKFEVGHKRCGMEDIVCFVCYDCLDLICTYIIVVNNTIKVQAQFINYCMSSLIFLYTCTLRIFKYQFNECIFYEKDLHMHAEQTS